MASWGRRKAATEVYLNVYDLSPSNQYLHQFGLGVFHSGVEVHGVEWTFSGGSGVFSMTPKQVPGGQQAVFRESVLLGTTQLSSREVEGIIAEMRDDFPASSYNVLSKNCNSFADEFSKRLLRKAIPGYVNRLAYLGSFLSCLLPQDMQGQAPVEGPGGGGGGSASRGGPTRRAAAAPRRTFTGSGLSLDAGSGNSSTATSNSARPSSSSSAATGAGAGAGAGSGGGGGGADDALRARREMLAQAALLRQQRAAKRAAEQQQQQDSSSGGTKSTASTGNSGSLRRR